MRQRLPSIIVTLYLLLCIVLGGSGQGLWRNLALQLLGIGLIAFATIRPAPRETREDDPFFVYLLIGLGLAVALVQLLPLTVSLSHAPYRSVMTLFALIPALAMFVAVKLLQPSGRWLAFAVALGMAASIALGALQVAGGPKSWAYLYEFTNTGAVGTFANRNHLGTLLLVSIPFATALLVSSKGDRGGSRQGRVAIAAAALVLVAAGILLNGSLAAIALALPVLMGSAALVPAAARWRRVALPLSGLALAAAVAVIAMTPIASVASGMGVSTSVQSRAAIWSRTSDAVGEHLPWGSGLGTFEPIYRQQEDPAAVNAEYVNHAHNDYLELALELGVPGIMLMALLLAWWAVAAFKQWTSPLSTPFGRAATIASAAILAHSAVDYPLRTGAIAAIFGAAIALMAQRQRSGEEQKDDRSRPARHVSIG